MVERIQHKVLSCPFNVPFLVIKEYFLFQMENIRQFWSREQKVNYTNLGDFEELK